MKELPQRKPNRLKDYDYSQDGAYFVTICAKDRLELFATIDTVGAAICRPCPSQREACGSVIYHGYPNIELSDIGHVIDVAINNIPKIYPSVFVNTYIIMPNHIHLILVIDNLQFLVDNGRQVAAPTKVQTIIGHMKRFVSMQCGYSVWQKSFHDHIIRNENEYRRIAEYIQNNPQTWTEDCFYIYNADGTTKSSISSLQA